jgi:hypothetical protein
MQVLLPANPSPLVTRLAAAVESHAFSAPVWATLGGNIVTVLGGLALARRGMPDLDTTRTDLVVKDGGTVGLDWVRASASASAAQQRSVQHKRPNMAPSLACPPLTSRHHHAAHGLLFGMSFVHLAPPCKAAALLMNRVHAVVRCAT